MQAPTRSAPDQSHYRELELGVQYFLDFKFRKICEAKLNVGPHTVELVAPTKLERTLEARGATPRLEAKSRAIPLARSSCGCMCPGAGPAQPVSASSSRRTSVRARAGTASPRRSRIFSPLR